jgi:HEAT repeat protein
MIYATEAKLSSRAKALGESASAESFAELQGYCASESPLVRRVAASAIGKLSGVVNEKRVLGTGYASV